VAHSWAKHVARSDNLGKEMRRRGAGRTALRWTADNALYELLGRTGTPRETIRYEDFVAAPEETTRRLATFLGLDAASVGDLFPTSNTVNLAADHSVWGNPMRLRSGPETLRPDEGWREQMPAGSRRTVTALSWPALARYGYLREPEPDRDSRNS
jgi:hypothetical protein